MLSGCHRAACRTSLWAGSGKKGACRGWASKGGRARVLGEAADGAERRSMRRRGRGLTGGAQRAQQVGAQGRQVERAARRGLIWRRRRRLRAQRCGAGAPELGGLLRLQGRLLLRLLRRVRAGRQVNELRLQCAETRNRVHQAQCCFFPATPGLLRPNWHLTMACCTTPLLRTRQASKCTCTRGTCGQRVGDSVWRRHGAPWWRSSAARAPCAPSLCDAAAALPRTPPLPRSCRCRGSHSLRRRRFSLSPSATSLRQCAGQANQMQSQGSGSAATGQSLTCDVSGCSACIQLSQRGGATNIGKTVGKPCMRGVR